MMNKQFCFNNYYCKCTYIIYVYVLLRFFSAALLSFPVILLQSESRADTASMMESDGKGKSQDGKKEKGQAKSLSARRSLSNEFRQAANIPDRGQKRQSSSPGSSVTKYYRLDFMFGSSSEKVARQCSL